MDDLTAHVPAIQPDGTVLLPPELMHNGQVHTMPAGRTEAPALGAPAPAHTIPIEVRVRRMGLWKPIAAATVLVSPWLGERRALALGLWLMPRVLRVECRPASGLWHRADVGWATQMPRVLR